MTDLKVQIATAHGIELFRQYEMKDAARLLKLSPSTLRRLKNHREVGYVQVSPKRVRFFGYQLCDYLVGKICPVTDDETTKSASGGWINAKTVQRGTAVASTPRPDKQSELAYARTILKKPGAH